MLYPIHCRGNDQYRNGNNNLGEIFGVLGRFVRTQCLLFAVFCRTEIEPDEF